MPVPASSSTKPLKCLSRNPNSQNSSATATATATATVVCKHCPSASLDLLIRILILFSSAFLLISYFSYLFHSLTLLFTHYSSSSSSLALHLLLRLPAPSYIFGFLAFFAISLLLAEFCCGSRSRRCDKPRCKGLKKAMEFDLQLQTEDSLKSDGATTVEVDRLPWKGGSEVNPDYECLRAELRKMAPPNGRAVFLFRSRCGCPVAKLEGWGLPDRGRRHKKALANMAANGDHR